MLWRPTLERLVGFLVASFEYVNSRVYRITMSTHSLDPSLRLDDPYEESGLNVVIPAKAGIGVRCDD